jgi:hypothetical protein
VLFRSKAKCWEFQEKVTGTTFYFWGTKSEAEDKNPSALGVSAYKLVEANKSETDCKAAEQFPF